MKLKLITLSTETEHPGWLKFKKSLDYFGYDYHLIFQEGGSGGHVFGTQMIRVYQYLKQLQKEGIYTHVCYCDSWDTIALGPFSELIRKLDDSFLFIGSAEKAVFPDPTLREQYPAHSSEWKFVNGGGWFSQIDHFCKWYEELPSKGINDQLWLAQRFLKSLERYEKVTLDYNCEVFQTLAFEGEEDFAFAPGKPTGRLVNLKRASLPLLCHGNARVPMDRFYNLLP